MKARVAAILAVALGTLCGTPAQAQTSLFMEALGYDFAAWHFAIHHGDPGTRLTGITITGLPVRRDPVCCDDLDMFYEFTFLWPEPLPWTAETESGDEGYPAPDHGWLVSGGTTSLSLTHARGFRGSADLYLFDQTSWHHDFLDPLRAELEGGTVTFTTVTPEPLSLLLLGTGLAGVAAARRRRRRPN